MTLALASRSKREKLTTSLAWVATACLTGCVVVPPPEPESPKIASAPAEGASPAPRKILPPNFSPGEEKSQKTKSQMEKMLEGIPQDAQNSDGEVDLPANAMNGYSQNAVMDEQQKRRIEMQNRRTDNEIAGSARTMDERKALEVGDLDRDLGVSPTENIGQAPSYISALQRIKDLFKRRDFENALVETNETLRFYPRSAQLLTMKGTLYQRLGQVDLALASYERAYDIEPSRKLLAHIEHLKNIVADRASIAKPKSGIVIPGDPTVTSGTVKGGS